MNDLDSLDPLVGPALHDRLRSEHVDLDHLAARSLRAGRSLRRRRRIGAAAGGALGVSAVALAVTQLPGGQTSAVDPDVATSPTADATVTAAPDDARDLPPGVPDTGLPVSPSAAGWACESFPVDEKMWCTKGALGLSVVVRPAADHGAWSGDPDKAGSSLWTSPVHGDYFVSVQGDGLGDAELDAFVAGLTFADAWNRP